MKRALQVIAIGSLLAASARADNLTYLDNGQTALADLYAKVRDAESEVDMSYFIIDFCSPLMHVLARELTEKMEAAKRAGKPFRARIVGDAVTIEPGMQSVVTEHFARLGIEVRFFNRETSHKKPTANFRNHLKMTVVDGKKFVSGGRNLADDYYGLSDDVNWVDRDVSVEGPTAAKAQAGFEALWAHGATYSPKAPDPARLAKEEKICLSKWGPEEARLETFLREHADEVIARTAPVSCAHVDYNVDDFAIGAKGILSPSTPSGYRNQIGLSRKGTTEALVSLLSSARESITLENYDYIPTAGVREALTKQRSRIPVLVVTNNFHFTTEPVDRATAREASAGNRGHETVLQLSRFGALKGSWELTPPGATFMIHSKVYVTDGKNAAITTSNLDPRSYRTNLEAGLIARNCPEFAGRVERATQRLASVWHEDEAEPCLRSPSPDPGWADRVYFRLIEPLL